LWPSIPPCALVQSVHAVIAPLPPANGLSFTPLYCPILPISIGELDELTAFGLLELLQAAKSIPVRHKITPTDKDDFSIFGILT